MDDIGIKIGIYIYPMIEDRGYMIEDRGWRTEDRNRDRDRDGDELTSRDRESDISMQIQIEAEVQIDFKSDSFDTKVETEGHRDSGWRGGWGEDEIER